MKKLSLAILMATAAMHAGCGGSSSSSDTPAGNTPDPKPTPTTQNITLKGVVYDPTVEQAVVKFCQIQDATNCADTTTISNSLGGYELNISLASGADLSQYAVFTQGGTDTQTKRSFQDISMSAPYSLQNNSVLNPNPISSMMTKAMKEGKSADAAKAEVMAQLGVNSKDFTQFQSWSIDTQIKSILLSELAAQNKDQGGFNNLAVSQGNMAKAIEDNLSDANEKKRWNVIYNQAKKAQTFDEALLRYLATDGITKSSGFTGLSDITPDVEANIDRMITAAVVAVKSKGATQVSQQNMEALLAQYSSVDLATAGVSLPALDTSAITVQTAYLDHKEALQTPLEDNDQAKRDYFYQSTASHLVKSEQFIAGETDVNVNDKVFDALVDGYLNNGQVASAIRFIDQKVFKAENEAKNLIKVAQYKIKNETNMSAFDKTFTQAMLDKAFTLQKTILTERGVANINSNDVVRLEDLITEYAKLNLTTQRDAVITYLETVQNSMDTTDPSIWNSYAMGLYEASDEAKKRGDTSDAIRLLDKAEVIAKKIPIMQGDPMFATHVIRVAAMSEVAKRYAALGEDSKAFALAEATQAIRADDGNPANDYVFDTSHGTANYAGDYLAPILIKGGYTEAQITTLASTAVFYFGSTDEYPGVWANWATDMAQKATSDAEMTAAIDLATSKLAQDGFGMNTYYNLVNALTYEQLGTDTPYMAQSLINKGEVDKAEKAIDAAVAVLDKALKDGAEYSDSGREDNYVTKGYAKMAYLYHKINLSEKSKSAMDKALAIANGSYAGENADNVKITDKASQSEAHEYMIFHANNMKNPTQAIALAEAGLEINKGITDLSKRVSKDYSLARVLYRGENRDYFSTIDKITDDIVAVATGSAELDSNGAQDDLNAKTYQLGIHATDFYAKTGNTAKVTSTTETLVGLIDGMSVPDKKAERQEDVVRAYASILESEKAQQALAAITAADPKLDAKIAGATTMASYDAFPFTDIATVDTDRDGRPDFFEASATVQSITDSGLTRDDDSDGDGVMDAVDTTPFYNAG